MQKSKKKLDKDFGSGNLLGLKPGACIPTREAYKLCPVKTNQIRLHELVQGPVAVLSGRIRKQADDRKKKAGPINLGPRL